MQEENPYQPPGDLSEPIRSNTTASYADDSTFYRIPRSFWVAWGGMVALSALAFVGVFSLGEAMIGTAIGGLLLAVYVAFRCQLCERYQHRCMTYGGIRIFLPCFVVCIGFGYLALGIAFGLYTFLIPVLHSSNEAMAGGLYDLNKLPAFIAASIAIAAYLKLIQMNARRPTISAPTGKL
ncbi:MAG: hypothetical protein FJ308_11340 [Planctomycetes bacterium]|nr:hypothetical protein [Planctomycetota bacterium]